MNGYNFTERVRKVLSDARAQAVALRHEYVGTEHMLLGLLNGGGVAEAALVNLGISPEEVRQRVLDTVRPGPADVAASAESGGLLGAIADTMGFSRGPDLPYTSRAKKVLELAMSEARNLSHSYVGTEHLLLGIMREERGIAAQVLASVGLTVNGVRDEIMRILGGEMPERPREVQREPRHRPTDAETAITLVI